MLILMINFVIFCIIATIFVGLENVLCGIHEKRYQAILFGAICLIIGTSGFVLFINTKLEIHIPAEPLAHNQTQTVFTTDKGTYLADGLYPDGTYLLTVDGKDVLVVWQAVDGEVG